jgi:ATP:ADP antiporter, AAA family
MISSFITELWISGYSVSQGPKLNALQDKPSKLVPTVFVGISAFFSLMSYSFIRPITDAMYIQKYGSQNLPYIWIATGIMIFVSVTLYNRCVKGYKILDLVAYTSIISFILLLILWFGLLVKVNHIEIILYIVKDIYIIFIIEQCWTLCSLIHDEGSAKKYYGFVLALSSIGSVLGDFTEASIVRSFGSLHTFLFGLIAMIIAILLALFARLKPGVLGFSKATIETWKTSVSTSGGFRILFRKRYLLMIFLLVLIIQFVTAEIDLEFNGVIERTFPSLDDKSQVLGYLNFSINGLSLLVNLAVTAPVLRLLGVFFVLFGGPVIQLIGSVAYAFLPVFSLITGLKVFNKSCDYSIYRAAKEILYLPLSYEEKNKAKTTIDVMIYRIGKAVAGLFLLMVKSLFSLGTSTLMIVIIGSLGLWIMIVYSLRREHAGLGNKQEQMR